MPYIEVHFILKKGEQKRNPCRTSETGSWTYTRTGMSTDQEIIKRGPIMGFNDVDMFKSRGEKLEKRAPLGYTLKKHSNAILRSCKMLALNTHQIHGSITPDTP